MLLTRAGDFDSAIRKYVWSLRGGPPKGVLLTALGLAALRTPLLPQDVPADRQDLSAAAGMTAFSQMTGDRAAAARNFQSLLDRFPDAHHVHYLYGCSLLAADPDAAIREFHRELELTPESSGTLAMLSWTLLNRGEAAAALPYAEKAVKVDPAYQLAQYVAGRALSEIGHPERGIEYLERAVKSDPSNVETHIALAAAYPKLRRFEDARRERRKSLELTQEAAPVLYCAIASAADSPCTSCHREQGHLQPATDMAAALLLAGANRVLQEHPKLNTQRAGYSYTVENNTYTVTDGKESLSLAIKWAFGTRSQTWVFERNGHFYESVVSYYPGANGLDTTIGDASIQPHTLMEAAGWELSDFETKSCFACHATAAVTANKLTLDALTPGVQCERCHEGATAHYNAITHGKTAHIPAKLHSLTARGDVQLLRPVPSHLGAGDPKRTTGSAPPVTPEPPRPVPSPTPPAPPATCRRSISPAAT